MCWFQLWGVSIISKFPSPIPGHICADFPHASSEYDVNVIISVNTMCVIAPHQFLTNHQNTPGPFKEVFDSVE